MFSKNNFLIDLALVVILVMAGVFVWVNNPGNSLNQKTPGPVVKYLGQVDSKSPLPKPEALPKDIPAEFLVDPQAVLVVNETKNGLTTAIFNSKLTPTDLMAKFLSGILAKEWKVSFQNKDASSAQIVASLQNKNSLASTVQFRATQISQSITELYIKYSK